MQTILTSIEETRRWALNGKKKIDLLIVRITNLKTYAAIEAIIIGMAN